MMPPNAQNISGGVAGTTEVTTPSATNATYTPIFSDDAVDHSQAEVAKTFHWREFGNGSANQGAGGTLADGSMLNTTDAIAYVMDDGLTCLSAGTPRLYANGLTGTGFSIGTNNNDHIYVTFIGTGISYTSVQAGRATYNIAMNLPYGTHILKINRLTTTTDTGQVFIDGVNVWDQPAATYGLRYPVEFSFHQPKRPPIPEDAVVLADYMLMADFVREANPSSIAGADKISKGTRLVDCSRDMFYDDVNGFLTAAPILPAPGQPPSGFYAGSNSTASSDASDNRIQLPAFGTTFIANGYAATTRNDAFIDGVDVAHSGTAVGNHADIIYPDSAVALGQHTFALHGNNSVAYSPYVSGKGFQIVSPIHTSSHYQTFETPYLHELVGGDRNMEQTNLVVTPDGKTWDEVTRDVSYLSSLVFMMHHDISPEAVDYDKPVIFDVARGSGVNATKGMVQKKHFALGYDRLICLVTGVYEIIWISRYADSGGQLRGSICLNSASNATNMLSRAGNDDATNWSDHTNYSTVYLQRGDYLSVFGGGWNSVDRSNFSIKYISK
jgi:hypothetical protein